MDCVSGITRTSREFSCKYRDRRITTVLISCVISALISASQERVDGPTFGRTIPGRAGDELVLCAMSPKHIDDGVYFSRWNVIDHSQDLKTLGRKTHGMRQ